MGEVTTVAGIDGPIRKQCLTMRMESLKCRTWAKQHDDEVDSFANANPQPPQAPLPRLQEGFPRLPQPPQAKPIVPRRTILHHDTSYSLINPSIQPLAGHIQNASNTLLEPHVPVVVTVHVVSTSVPQRETPGFLLAHPHPPPQLVPSPTGRAGSVNRRTSPPLRRVLQPLQDL